MNIQSRCWLLASAGILALGGALPAFAADAAADSSTTTPITNSDDIVVTATKVNQATPITASIHTFEPQAIVSRAIIEDSIAPTADYSQIVLFTPGASILPSSGNGVGLGDTKIVLRGFQDGQYNMTYDGIPFEDSNDPTHHSTSYFPDGTYERLIIDRGPGAATDLGQASYGGNIHIISRDPTKDFGVQEQALYGSFNTFLERLTVNSGEIKSLGDMKVIAVGEYKRTDGALTNQPGWWGNGYVKIVKPLGDNAQFSILANYNQSLFNQSDAAGGATAAQVAVYGKQFGATTADNPGDYANARKDWNWQNKTTDMEVARLQWEPSSIITIDNKLYTFFYKNFTLSTEDSSDPCNTIDTSNNTCSLALATQVYAQGSGLGGGGGKVVAGDIAGYTKVNQYRDWGDILQVDVKTPIGVLKLGAWYEHSQSHRYRYEYDFTKGAANGGISNYTFNFDIMNDGQNWNWLEKDKSYNVEQNGSPVPAYINYDERTKWNQEEVFGDYEIKALNDTLTVTPGFKALFFTREIDSPIADQHSRIGGDAQETYKPVLPYATVNYLITPQFSAYAQYARGFIVPALSVSLETKGNGNVDVPVDPVPTKTTNYQAGVVFAGQRLNFDGDIYYIKASNSTSVDPTNSNSVTLDANPAIYKGIEGQISYVVVPGLTAIANATLMSSKDAVTGLWLAYAPDYTATFGAVYSMGHLKLSYLHKLTGRQYEDGASSGDEGTTTGGNNVRLAPYSYEVLSASGTYGNVTVGVTVNNPLGTRPITAQSGPSSSASTLYLFQAPTSYQAQIKLRF